MRVFVAAMTLTLLALPVQAQQGGKSKLQNDGPQKEDAKPKVDDKAYGNALGNLPTKKYDPWKDMR
jgi:hypothetical protein